MKRNTLIKTVLAAVFIIFIALLIPSSLRFFSTGPDKTEVKKLSFSSSALFEPLAGFPPFFNPAEGILNQKDTAFLLRDTLSRDTVTVIKISLPSKAVVAFQKILDSLEYNTDNVRVFADKNLKAAEWQGQIRQKLVVYENYLFYEKNGKGNYRKMIDILQKKRETKN